MSIFSKYKLVVLLHSAQHTLTFYESTITDRLISKKQLPDIVQHLRHPGIQMGNPTQFSRDLNANSARSGNTNHCFFNFP